VLLGHASADVRYQVAAAVGRLASHAMARAALLPLRAPLRAALAACAADGDADVAAAAAAALQTL